MKAFPNYHYKTVDITDIYNLEKQFFGILQDGKVLTPNEYWRLKENNFLDVLSGVFYLTWVPVPLLFAVYLFFKNRKQFFYFSLTFLLVNLLGFVIYYVHPTAPPWFVQYYGFSFQPLKAGNTAGLAKFDLYFGLDIFKSIYAKGSNVFAAMPSLHSSYPVIVLFFALRNKMGYWNVIFFIVMVGIGFAAVYTSHHYILDVLAGIVTALIGIFIFQRILKRTKWLNAFVNILLDATK
jgi:membrane-associated phospholipid phosphatase